MMDIGKSIFKEIENLPRFTVSCPPFLLTEEPMVRLSDLKKWLETLGLTTTVDPARHTFIDITYEELENE